MIDRKAFFAEVKITLFVGKLSQSQVDGMTAILDEWERRKLTDMRWLAYMLATTKWETAHTMQPIQEYGSLKYLMSKRYWPWIGRGFVQLTWEFNYKKFQGRVEAMYKVDLMKNPEAAMRLDVATFILFEGMINGEFTGKKLATYFNSSATDWRNARRIINGTDKASKIAEIAIQFHKALT